MLLAVALLKDRNGVIDINLPISGSINDPQFSVFGIVPEGDRQPAGRRSPRRSRCSPAAAARISAWSSSAPARERERGRAALDKVIKALADREALKMTVTSAADAAGERETFQRARRWTPACWPNGAASCCAPAPSSADADAVVSLNEAVRVRVLKEVYRATSPPEQAAFQSGSATGARHPRPGDGGAVGGRDSCRPGCDARAGTAARLGGK